MANFISKFSTLKLNGKDIYFYIFLAIYTGLLILISLQDYIWIDEAYSLMTSSRSLKHAFEGALIFELQPPLYYMILNLWRNLSDSIFFARLLSIVFIVISAFPLKSLLKKLYGSRHQLFTILFLTSAVIITYALEIRYISLMLLFAILIEYLFLITYNSSKPKPIFRFYYVVISILGVYTQYYFSFLLIANFIILLFQGRKKIISIYLLDMVLPVLSLAVLYPYIDYQMNQSGSHCQLNASPIFFLTFLFYHTGLLLREFFPFLSEIIRIIYKPLTIALLAIVFFWAQWKYFSLKYIRSQYHYVLKTIILLLLYAFMATMLKFQALYIRYLVLLFIPLWIIIFDIINLIRRERLLYVCVIALTLTSLGHFTYEKIQHPKGQRNLSIVNYIMNHEQPGEPIFVYRNYMELVLKHAYDGNNKIHQIPGTITYDQPGSQINWSIENYHEVDSVFNLHYSRTIWLITTNDNLEGRFCIETHDEILTEYVSEHFAVVSKKKFDKIKVQKLKWKDKYADQKFKPRKIRKGLDHKFNE